MAIAPCGKDLGEGNYFCMSPEWSGVTNHATGKIEYRQYVRSCMVCWAIWYFKHLMSGGERLP